MPNKPTYNELEQKLKELEEAEANFRELFDSINDLIYTQDLSGRFLYANRAMFKLFGYSPDEFIGRRAADFMRPKFKQLYDSGYLSQVKKYGYHQGISSYLTKNGGIIYLEYHSTLFRPEKGSPFISGTGRDVTERILADRQIKMLQSQMLQSQKMEAIGTLAGGIAHDFNNLLMGVQGRTSLMLMDIDSSHPHYEHLKGIEAHIRSAAELTGQLLGFASGGKYNVRAADPNELVDNSAEMFGRTKKEITIRSKYQEEVWMVEIDRGQIEQVLLNLYVNAWQAMPGGGELYLETENLVLDAEYVRPLDIKPGRYVRISVTDSGMGMDEKTVQRIFEPFFTTKEMGRGTGLGLATVYGIIKNHGGMIDVFSKRGQGSRFTVYLPAGRPEGETTKVVDGNDHRMLPGTETILFVDDEDIIVEVGIKMLEGLGYKVLTAKSAIEAIGFYKREGENIDLIILDMIMPEMGGGDAYDKLKEIDPNIRVLLSSGYSIDGQASEILSRGCSGFIQKPFNLLQLSRKIREVLEIPNGCGS